MKDIIISNNISTFFMMIAMSQWQYIQLPIKKTTTNRFLTLLKPYFFATPNVDSGIHVTIAAR